MASGCARKIEYIYVKQELPKELLEPEYIAFHPVKNQSEAAVLILDLYKATENCNLKLKKIKELNDERFLGTT